MIGFYVIGMLFMSGILVSTKEEMPFGTIGNGLINIIWVLLWPFTLGMMIANLLNLYLRPGD